MHVLVGILLGYGLVFLVAELVLADTFTQDPDSCGTALTAAAEDELHGPNEWVAVLYGIWLLACWSIPLSAGSRSLPTEARRHWRWLSGTIACAFAVGSVIVVLAHEFLVLLLVVVFGLPVAFVFYVLMGLVIRRRIKTSRSGPDAPSRGAEFARSLRLDASIVTLFLLSLGGYFGLLFGPLANTLEVSTC